MTTVNPYFLETLIEPLTGLGDDDEAVIKFSSMDPNDEVQVRQVIRDLIVPHSKLLSGPVQERVKLAYRYYLSKENANFGRVFDANLPPFDHPSDPRNFFVWVWEECFPGEDFRLAHLEGYVENADVNEPLRLWESTMPITDEPG